MADNIFNNRKTDKQEAPIMESPVSPVEYTHFLVDKRVRVKPVVREKRWEQLLDHKRRDAFMYNSTKRTYTLPVSGRNGQLVSVLDTMKRVTTPQYPNREMTEKEFFEEQLKKDLNLHNKKEDNFWYTDNLSKITITKDGLDLDLSHPVDAIRLKILLANKNLIAIDKASAEKIPTFEFYIEDSEIEQTLEAEFANTKMDAYGLFHNMKENSGKLANFLKVAARGVNSNATLPWLRGEVYKMLEENPSNFLVIARDPLFEEKAFVYDALKAGAIIRKGRDEFALDTGTTIGSMHSTIAYLNKPENSALYNGLRERVERAGK